MVIEVERMYVVAEESQLPMRGSSHAAGFDLRSNSDYVIKPGRSEVIKTGVRIALPEGTCGQMWPRSGLAVRASIDVLGGLIDEDYRGEIMVILINHGNDFFRIAKGDRIAQLVIVPYVAPEVVSYDALPNDTERGDGGLGSTGVK